MASSSSAPAARLRMALAILVASLAASSLPAPASADPIPSYCNWSGCDGVTQGGPWCNKNLQRCEGGCGGQWCVDGPAPASTPPPAPTGGYCNWNSCNGEIQGGEWCNGNKQQCIACGSGSMWCGDGDGGGGSPLPTPPVGSGKVTLKATHFWDCSGAACDAKTLQPWDPSRYRYSAMYAPLDPSLYQGGAWYGEKMWMTGAASDILSEMMGPDDSCCGQDSEDIGGCGKCLLVTNPSAVNSDWKAVVMKKNRCPPWATGCDKAHMDIAVPGYDNLQYSLANICGQSDTIISKAASSVCGDWYNFGGNTIQGCSCSALPDSTEHEAALKTGCELFTAWGWSSGDPTLEYEVVECPSEFVSVISASFGPSGPIY